MLATLLWTINDFSTYRMLSRWSTHGVLSCPLCMEYSKAFYLKTKGKNLLPFFFFGHCHVLDKDNPFQKDKKYFENRKVENFTFHEG